MGTRSKRYADASGARRRLSLFVSYCLAIVGMLLIFFVELPAPVKATHGGQCGPQDWEEGGGTDNGYTGVSGYNETFDATAPGNYINGVEVVVDANNIVELGWFELDASGQRRFYSVVLQAGMYSELDEGPASIGTHTYLVWNSGNTFWHYRIDGSTVREEDLTFYAGQPIAHRERHDACSSETGHWWNLNRCSGDGSCVLWPSHGVFPPDADPHTYADFVAHYEFYVRAN